MIEQVAPPQDGGLIPTPPLQYLETMHDIAKSRFLQNPEKCYQRHIRELYAEIEHREPLTSLKGATVERIARDEAATIILKYEWLRTLGSGVRAYYGLKLNGELLGAVCLGTMGGDIRKICGDDYADKTVCLMRGACAPHAPKDAASFLVRHACRQAFKDFGWCVFFAYSDSDAGEIGTVYQAVGWHFIGEGLGRPSGSYHTDYQSPDGKMTVSSYKLNHDKKRTFVRSLGWDESKGPMRPYLESLGWKPLKRYGKKKWVWFEGPEKSVIKDACRYQPLPYPKRRTTN
jgi:hypothetical protein